MNIDPRKLLINSIGENPWKRNREELSQVRKMEEERLQAEKLTLEYQREVERRNREIEICQSKSRFDSQISAQRCAIRRRLSTKGLRLWIYECPICKQFHLTKKEKQ